MRISIHTLGTRGDVQPYLALASGLKAEGHDVLLAAPSQFEAFVTARGIGFAPLPAEFLDLMDSAEARAIMSGAKGVSAGLQLLKRFRPIGRRLLTAEWTAARQFAPELVIYHPKAVAALHIAQKLGVPAVLASPIPGFTPTRSFASPLVPFRSLGPLNPMTHRVMAKGSDALFRSMIAGWRVEELELGAWPSRPLQPHSILYAYSRHLLAVPPDWPANVAVTGNWTLPDTDWEPDAALDAFLKAGEPPVYVGFGSMPGTDPARLTPLVRSALAMSGKRGVLATGGGALEPGPPSPSLHAIVSAPHDRLFPRLAACIHHGGAGTTAASLAAGRPTIICPFFGDQPFWGRRVRQLGVGPAPLPIKRLSDTALAAAISEATSNKEILRKAARLAEELQAEDGVANAISFLQQQRVLA